MLRRKLQNLAEYEVVKMPNGATLALHPRRDSLTVDLSLYFQLGSSYDPLDKINRSHLAEHMMFRKNSSEQYWSRLNSYSRLFITNMNAECLADSISIGPDSVSILPQNSPEAIRLLGEMIYDPVIDGAHLNSEKEVAYLEMKAYSLSERYMHHLKVSEELWGKKHPYVKAKKPGLEGIRRLKPQDMAETFEYLRGSGVYISLVGSYGDDDIKAVEEAFGTSNHGKPIPDISKTPESRTGEKVIMDRPKDLDALTGNCVIFNYTLPPVSQDDCVRATVIDRYLSDNYMLYRILRDERDLCYGVGVNIDTDYKAEIEMNKQAPRFAIEIDRFREKNTDTIIDLVKGEVEKLKQGDIDKTTLERALGKIDGEFTKYDSGECSAEDFAQTEMFGMKRPVDRYEIMMSTTTEDIKRIAQQYFVNPVISVELHKNGHKKPTAGLLSL